MTESSTALVDKPFFVGGQGKSGTTWLQLLLDAHPQISCCGEAHFADQLSPRLLNAIQDYGSFVERNNKLFSELPGYPIADQHDGLSVCRFAIQNFLNSQNKKGASIVGERSPANIENMSFLHSIFPGASFVHVIRDPRDVTVSLWHHFVRTEQEQLLSKYGDIDQLARQLVPAWVKGIKSARKAREKHQVSYLEIQYEHLLEQPQQALRNVARFLGADTAPEIISDMITAAAFEKLSGGRQSGTEDSQSHFRKGISGDWQNHISASTAQELAEYDRELMQQLGYNQ